MTDLVLGVLLIVLGAYLCLSGQGTLRVLLALWGGLVGLFVGVSLVAGLAGDGFGTTAAAWLVGAAFALLFATLAYLWFAVAVVLAMGSAGFTAGGAVASALGATSPWLLVLAGALVGLLLAVLAIVVNLPRILLVVASAVFGASMLLTGVLLVSGVRDVADLTSTDFALPDHPWWYVAHLILIVVGVVVQSQRSVSPMRGTWEPSPR